ncbi:MAG TPA: YggS family pyridoxal phosphate-dependent enzyme [Vicinamibacterales bacterium]|jgi:pyridoxal phosphate enzyme (YggS family)|nr:YggS family pyridoxal phosphate-dependent enzyme [Vicinamibacterales bacterium]
MPQDADIAIRLDRVRRRIDAAAQRAGRSPASITLVAVSKTFGPDAVRAAAAAGQRVFGENRVQEAVAKIDALRDLDLDWHLIGYLQTNKAKKAAAACAWIESVDRVELLQKLDAAAVELGVRRSILLQVDLAHEATKHGADAAGLRPLADAALASRALDLRGLMLVPPIPAQADDSRPWFRELRDLRDRLVAGGVPADRLAELSMGMSHDFEVAIEEGATMVRVGSAIFGTRAPVA